MLKLPSLHFAVAPVGADPVAIAGAAAAVVIAGRAGDIGAAGAAAGAIGAALAIGAPHLAKCPLASLQRAPFAVVIGAGPIAVAGAAVAGIAPADEHFTNFPLAS